MDGLRRRVTALSDAGLGKPIMPIKLQEIVGDADEVPFCGDFFYSSEGETVEASKLLDLSKQVIHDVLSFCVGASPFDSA